MNTSKIIADMAMAAPFAPPASSQDPKELYRVFKARADWFKARTLPTTIAVLGIVDTVMVLVTDGPFRELVDDVELQQFDRTVEHLKGKLYLIANARTPVSPLKRSIIQIAQI